MYVADAVGLFGLMLAITTARFGFRWPDFSSEAYYTGFSITLAVHMLTAYFGGLYDREQRLGSPSWLARITRVVMISGLITASMSLGASKFLMARLSMVFLAILATALFAFNRWLARTMLTSRYGRPKVFLVGNPDDISLIEEHLEETDRDAVVVGRATTIERLLGDVERTDATEVLLLNGIELSEIYPDPLSELELRRIGVYHRLEPSDTLLGLKKTRQIAGVPFLAIRSHALPPSKAHFKRVLDLLYISLASPVLVPVTLLLCVYCRIVAGSPMIYRQERLGRYGKPFTMVKFRTMYPDSESQGGPRLADRDDNRVIPAMAWLRATRLDEFPQLWNVLKGDMSLVGPRPERPELIKQFEMVIPGYGRRHDIRPGITGLAQVQGRYHTDPGYKLGHDLQYLVNWSPIFDVQILLQTVWVVLSRRV